MTRQETVNKAAQSLLDAGCDLVSITTTWHKGGATECLMMVPRESNRREVNANMAPKKSPAKKKKPAAKMPMPGMPMAGMGKGKGMGPMSKRAC